MPYLLTRLFRALLDRLHPLFTCCASCGEIRYGGRGYLCGSLAPQFAVDCVVLSPDGGDTRKTAALVRKRLPWLRRVHIADGVFLSGSGEALFGVSDLAGHFLVAHTGFQEVESFFSLRRNRKFTPMDFFTANGIPLLRGRGLETLPREQEALLAFMAGQGLKADARLDFATPLPAVTGEMLAGFPSFFAAFTDTPGACRTKDAVREKLSFFQGQGAREKLDESVLQYGEVNFFLATQPLGKNELCSRRFLSDRLPDSVRRDATAPERRPDIFFALGQWAYATGLAIPVGEESGRPGTKKQPRRAEKPAGAVFSRPPGACVREKAGNLVHDICVRLHPVTPGCGACPHVPASLETLVCHDPAPDFPVDVVYTWVNGDDPVHAAKRAAFLPQQQDLHSNALDPARFRDNDDLRYSLRSLDLFAPWVRRIILVTDGQTPAWLDVGHPKIRIVDHRDCIPARYLPTFNSHVIEAYLHNIPGLAEHFIYMNDDLYLGRPCRKSEFFTPNGLPLSLVDWRWRRIFGYWWTKTPHAQSYYNTLDFLKKKGTPTDAKFITAHGPYAQTRSNISAAFAFYKEKIEAFASNKFRTVNELAVYSHAAPLWLYGKKKLVPCDERHFYVQTDREDRVAYYTGILNAKDDSAAPLFFCINDVRDNSDSTQWLEDFHALMRAYFPLPSPYELLMPALDNMRLGQKQPSP